MTYFINCHWFVLKTYFLPRDVLKSRNIKERCKTILFVIPGRKKENSLIKKVMYEL